MATLSLRLNAKEEYLFRNYGDYRILALIEDDKILITLIDVGH